MSSTTLEKLSVTLQPEEGSVDQHHKVSYRKVDIDPVDQQEVKSIKDATQQPNGITNGGVPLTNGIGKENGTNDVDTPESDKTGSKIEKEINGPAKNQQTEDDRFQRLPKPQQEILVIHGPRQRYRLEKAHDIPELKTDHEILVQVGKSLRNPRSADTTSPGRCNWPESR